MPKEYSASELFILQFFSDVIRSHPTENVFLLEQIERKARNLAIPTHDFRKAWQSLIERGYLARMDGGTAAITNTCATFLRHAFFISGEADQPYLRLLDAISDIARSKPFIHALRSTASNALT